MKHKEEWYTCDRCGNEFDRLPQNEEWLTRMKMNRGELKMIYEKTEGYISDEHELTGGVLSVEIAVRSRRREKIIHLCPKCRKDFERFMDNE